MRKYLFLFLMLPLGFIAAQTRRDTAVSAWGDRVPVYKKFIGTVAQLRALNNTTYTSAQTTDRGNGEWYVNAGDASSADNGGNILVDAGGRRWYRQYQGADRVEWYREPGMSDSTTIMRAMLNCKEGIQLDSTTYKVRWIRPRRDNIYITGIYGKSVLKLDTAQLNGNCILLFQDSSDAKISNVQINNIVFDGDGINQTGANNSIIRCGLNYGGAGFDTVVNISFNNCQFKNGPSGRSSFWLLSDSLRNNNWSVKNCKFLSAYGGHVELRGSFNMMWDNNEFYDWAKADSSLYSAFGGQNAPNRNLTLQNSRFYNNKGVRFAIEISGTVVNGIFQNNYYDGNGRDGSGTSGPAWFGCRFINETKMNGGGGHRSGYELVGGNNVIDNCSITGGSIVIGSWARSNITVPAGWEQWVNNTYSVTKTVVYNMLGGALGIGGTDSLNNISVKGCTLTSGSSVLPTIAFQRGGIRDCFIEDNTMKAYNHYNVRLYNVKWSAADSINKNIVFKNNIMISNLAASSPNVLVSTPVDIVFEKWQYVVFDGNKYSQNNLYYKDSTIATWLVVDNKKIGETLKAFKYDQGAMIARGSGTPEGVVVADRGSLYTDITNNKLYKKTTDAINTGWVEIVSGGGGGGSSSGGGALKGSID